MLFRGLIHRQARCVLLDPYANAFYRDASRISQWKADHTEMKAGVHERKYELDSLASVLRLATGYFSATGDMAPFDEEFFRAMRIIVDTIRFEQAGTAEQIHPRYSFGRTTANATDTLGCGGHGNPCRRTGCRACPFGRLMTPPFCNTTSPPMPWLSVALDSGARRCSSIFSRAFRGAAKAAGRYGLRHSCTRLR